MSLQPQIKLFHLNLKDSFVEAASGALDWLNVSAAAFEFLVRGIMLGLLAATCRALVSSAVPKQKQKGFLVSWELPFKHVKSWPLITAAA